MASNSTVPVDDIGEELRLEAQAQAEIAAELHARALKTQGLAPSPVQLPEEVNTPNQGVGSQVPSQISSAAPAPASGPSAGAPQPNGIPVAPWGPFVNFGHSATLGANTPIEAGLNSLVSAGRDVANGTPVGSALSAIPGYYRSADDQLTAERQAWQAANPGQNFLTQLGGSMATLPLVMGKIAKGAQGITSLENPLMNFIMGRAGQNAPGIGNAVLRLGSKTASGALTGAEAGALGAGANDDSLTSNITSGAEGGAALGTLGSILRGIFGASLTPETAKLAQNMHTLGVDLTPAQAVNPAVSAGGNAVFRKTAGALGQTGSATADQLKAFSSALVKTIDPAAKDMSPDSLSLVQKNLGKQFQDITSRNDMNVTPDLRVGLRQIWNDLPKNMAVGSDAFRDAQGTIQTIMENIRQPIPGGGGMMYARSIPGKVYQDLTGFGGPIQDLRDSDQGSAQKVGKALRGLLDDAFTSSVSPEDAANWSDIRSKYNIFSALKPLGAKATPEGTIDPRLVNARLAAEFDNYGSGGTGNAALDTLAKGGRFLAPPTSGGSSMGAHAGPGGLAAGGVALGELASLFGHGSAPITPLLAGATAYGGSKLAGKALNNPNLLLRQPTSSASNYIPNALLNPLLPLIQQLGQ